MVENIWHNASHHYPAAVASIVIQNLSLELWGRGIHLEHWCSVGWSDFHKTQTGTPTYRHPSTISLG